MIFFLDSTALPIILVYLLCMSCKLLLIQQDNECEKRIQTTEVAIPKGYGILLSDFKEWKIRQGWNNNILTTEK